MTSELQELFIHILVAGAAIYLSLRAYRKFKQKKNIKGCGSSGGCGCKLTKQKVQIKSKIDD